MSTNCLLLLPAPPSEVSDAGIDAAYGPAVRNIINSTRGRAGKPPVLLDIAIHCNRGEMPSDAPRTYGYLEKIIALLYSLVIYTCSDPESPLEYDEIPDVAAFFVETDSDKQADLSPEDQIRQPGPVVTLRTLACCPRTWTSVYSLDGEAGQSLLQEFVERRRSLDPSSGCVAFQTHNVPGGTSLRMAPATDHTRSTNVSRHHSSVAVGGTFDHIHAGHKLLLTATALALERKEFLDSGQRMLTIGITVDELLKNKKHAKFLESWQHRQQAVFLFLSRILNFGTVRADEKHFNEPGPNGRGTYNTFGDGLTIKCVELSDPFGPTITDEKITALVVSAETRSGGQAVNDKRKEKNWKLLEVFEVDVLDSKPPTAEATPSGNDFQSKISSTEIRRRLQERAG